MCELVKKNLKYKEFTGYKIVAKHIKNGKYYSIAMGFRYPKNGPVPIPKKQKRIVISFNEHILDKSAHDGFRKNMVGRTAVYVTSGIAKNALHHYKIEQNNTTIFKYIIVKATIYNDLMEGKYGSHIVVAGKSIKFKEELKNDS